MANFAHFQRNNNVFMQEKTHTFKKVSATRKIQIISNYSEILPIFNKLIVYSNEVEPCPFLKLALALSPPSTGGQKNGILAENREIPHENFASGTIPALKYIRLFARTHILFLDGETFNKRNE